MSGDGIAGAAGGFDVGKFVESFPVIAEAEGGIERLRGLVLVLAMRGQLVPQSSGADAETLLTQLKRASERVMTEPKREMHLREGLLGADEIPWEVPPSWRFIRLEQLSAAGGLFCDGDWVESKDQDPAGEIRLTQLADVGDGMWRDRSDRRMNRATAERLRCTYLEPGDILIARMPDPLGRACVFPGDERICATVVDVAVLRIRDDFFERRFVMMAINSSPVREAINSMIAGTTRQRVSRSNLATVLLPVPPIDEQKRIVAKVDELMRLIDELEVKKKRKHEVLVKFRTAALESLALAEGLEELAPAWGRVETKARDILHDSPNVTMFRDCILTLACRGSLSSRYSGEEDVRVTISRFSTTADVRRGVPEEVAPSEVVAAWQIPRTWARVSIAELLRIGELIDVKDGNHGANHPLAREYVTDGVPFIMASNVRETIDYDGAKKLPPEVVARLRVGLSKPGDVIYTHKGTVGRVSISTRTCVLTPQTTYYRVRSPCRLLMPGYLRIALLAPQHREQVSAVSEQTTRDFIPVSRQYSIFVPLPPLAEQKRIVAKVDQLMALCDALEAALRRKEQTAAKLAAAVVAKLVA